MLSALLLLPVVSNGVESLVDRLDDDVTDELCSTEGEVSLEDAAEVADAAVAVSKSVYVSMVTSLIFRFPLALSRKDWLRVGFVTGVDMVKFSKRSSIERPQLKLTSSESDSASSAISI